MGHVEDTSKNESRSEGRSGDWGHEVQGHEVQGHRVQGHRVNGHEVNGRENGLSAGAASVVLHATIETFGPPGDAELNLTVKWPAASLAAASGGNKVVSVSNGANGDNSIGNSVNGTYDSDGNIHTPVSTPKGPVEP